MMTLFSFFLFNIRNRLNIEKGRIIDSDGQYVFKPIWEKDVVLNNDMRGIVLLKNNTDKYELSLLYAEHTTTVTEGIMGLYIHSIHSSPIVGSVHLIPPFKIGEGNTNKTLIDDLFSVRGGKSGFIRRIEGRVYDIFTYIR